MRAGNGLFLLRQHWRFHWTSWAVVALLVGVSGFVIALIGGANSALSAALTRWTADHFPPTVVTIRPEMPELGPVAVLMAAALPSIEQPRITSETIDQIETMPEVRNLYPVVTPTFPIHAEATFLGEGFGSDVVVAGIDRALIASDLRGGEPFEPVDWRAGEVVPVLLSTYFVDLFNQLYAPTFNTPPLSESTADTASGVARSWWP